MKRSKPYQESLIAALADPLEATEYLHAALEAGGNEIFLLALHNVAEARLENTGTHMLDTGLDREHLYGMLSGRGQPETIRLDQLLHALGLDIAVAADGHVA